MAAGVVLVEELAAPVSVELLAAEEMERKDWERMPQVWVECLAVDCTVEAVPLAAQAAAVVVAVLIDCPQEPHCCCFSLLLLPLPLLLLQ